MKSFLATLTCCLCSLFINGQNTIIELNNSSASDLTGEAAENYSKLSNAQMYTAHHFIDFFPLAERQDEGKIKINIPDHYCDDIIFQARSVEYISETDYYWHGKMEAQDSCECIDGTLTLLSSEAGMIGHITVDDDAYEITDFGNRQMVLSKVNDDQFTEAECSAVNSLSSNPGLNNNSATARSEGNCNVKCLVLYTQAAVEAETGNIDNRINLAIRQTNQILKNSNIDECELKIILAGSREVTFNSSSFILNDLYDLASSSEVQDIREELSADIVVLITNGDYGPIFGAANVDATAEDAYAIVQVGAATTARYTFAHEIAHIFGAGHDTDPRAGIPHAYNFRTGACLFGSKRRTILKVTANNPRIPYLSNPDVKYLGKKTGKEGEKDNAQVLSNKACTVAEFRTGFEPFGVNISTVGYACPCTPILLEAIASGGSVGAYVYEWSSSNDGINWTDLNNDHSHINLVLPCDEGEGFFVQVTATSSDDQVSTTSTYVEAAYHWPNQEVACPLSENIVNNSKLSFSAFPNPSSENWTIHITGEFDQAIGSLELMDTRGAILEIINIPTGKKDPIILINNHHLPRGLYFLRYKDKMDHSRIKKLIKQ